MFKLRGRKKTFGCSDVGRTDILGFFGSGEMVFVHAF